MYFINGGSYQHVSSSKKKKGTGPFFGGSKKPQNFKLITFNEIIRIKL